jgi:hypothetical protein
VQEVDDLEGRFGLVVGLADLGGHWLQGDRSEDVTQEQCRLAGLAFEQVLQTSNALGHPFDGWSLEDLAGGGFEGGELIPEGRGPLLGQLEGLTERRGPGVTAMLLKLLREECPTQLGSFNRCRSGSV